MTSYCTSGRLVPKPSRGAYIEWTESHSIMLCNEILDKQLFKYKKGSPKRGQMWKKVADSLNKCRKLEFRLTQRSARDKFALLQARFKGTNTRKVLYNGTLNEIAELHELIEEIAENKQTTKQNKKGSAKPIPNVIVKLEADQDSGEEVTKKTRPKTGQTQRKESEIGDECGCKRQSGNETIHNNPRKKEEAERNLREKELELKRLELEAQEKRAQESQSQHKELVTLLQQQQAMMLQQQQQQGQLMLALLESLKPK